MLMQAPAKLRSCLTFQAQGLNDTCPQLKKRMIEARVALELRKAVKHSNPPGIQGAIETAVREKVDSVEIQAARKYMCVYSLSIADGLKELYCHPDGSN